MAYILKYLYQGYFKLVEDYADPRLNDYPIIYSPLVPVVVLFIWTKFIFKWGPEYMKNRPPMEITKIMMVYNVIQVLCNGYLAIYTTRALTIMDWDCSPIIYTYDYWPMKLLELGTIYYGLKLADLLDTVFLTNIFSQVKHDMIPEIEELNVVLNEVLKQILQVFFVLRKKTRHMSFLHCYHHFMMILIGYMGVRFLSGGHSVFFAFANSVVHTVLYAYYLLTAYDSYYSQLLWLKKFITQLQLFQFFFLMYVYVRVLMVPNCEYPKPVIFLLIPQNIFMIILFGDFYIRTYILEPRRKKKLLLEEQAKNNEKETKGVAKAD